MPRTRPDRLRQVHRDSYNYCLLGNVAAYSREATETPVTLHVYDLGVTDLAPATLAQVNKLCRIAGAGAFHAAVEVYGKEWSFGHTEEGTGIFSCEPTKCDVHKYREGIAMGHTALTRKEVVELLSSLEAEWLGQQYDLLWRNCCHFSDAFCRRLGVGPIPAWVTNLAGAGATLQRKIQGVVEVFEAHAHLGARVLPDENRLLPVAVVHVIQATDVITKVEDIASRMIPLNTSAFLEGSGIPRRASHVADMVGNFLIGDASDPGTMKTEVAVPQHGPSQIPGCSASSTSTALVECSSSTQP